jgi:heme exporter protein A
LFADLNFSLKSGQIMQLAGPNGAGKTSLLRIIAGFAMPDEGEVLSQNTMMNLLMSYYLSVIRQV